MCKKRSATAFALVVVVRFADHCIRLKVVFSNVGSLVKDAKIVGKIPKFFQKFRIYNHSRPFLLSYFTYFIKGVENLTLLTNLRKVSSVALSIRFLL